VFQETAPGRFALNETAERLLDPVERLGLDLEGIGGRMAYAWTTLPTYVRTGAPGYHEVFGLPFWDDLAAHPEVAATFDELMGPAGHGAPDPEFRLTDGWESVRTVVDVGGGGPPRRRPGRGSRERVAGRRDERLDGRDGARGREAPQRRRVPGARARGGAERGRRRAPGVRPPRRRVQGGLAPQAGWPTSG